MKQKLNGKVEKSKLIQVTCSEFLYDHVKATEKKLLYSSPADVLRDAYRKQFIENTRNSE